MAAWLAGTATGPGAIESMFVQLDTLLLANGWTQWRVISSTAGTRDVVYKGTAIDATAGNAPFIRLTEVSSTIFAVRCYSDWDPTSNTGGINEGGTTSTSQSAVTLSDSTFGFYARVNGVSLHLVYKVGSTLTRQYVGFLRPMAGSGRNGITKTTQAYAAGVNNMNVASSMVGKLYVGQKVLIMNFAHNGASANKSNAEVVTIQSIAAGNIVFTGVTTKAYDSGAIIGENPYPNTASGGVNNTNATPPTFYLPFNPDGTYTSNFQNTATGTAATFSPVEANNDPHKVYQTFTGMPIAIGGNVTGKAGFIGSMYSTQFTEGGNQVTEDLINDGVSDHMVIAVTTSNGVVIGPIN